MAILKATQVEIDAFLHDHKDWRVVDGKLVREVVFRDFVTAFGFMTQVALLAEKQNHHPEWCNVYSRVTIQLTTHEAGAISQRDFELAAAIDQLANEERWAMVQSAP